MKKLYVFLAALLCLNYFLTLNSNAQERWAKDVLVDNAVTNQTLPRLRVADNGYIFIGFVDTGGCHVAVSKDYGSTWSTWADYSGHFFDWDMEITGTTASTIKIWFAASSTDSLTVASVDSAGMYTVALWIPPVGTTCQNVSMATDYQNPGGFDTTGNFIIGVALTLQGATTDSLMVFQLNDSAQLKNKVTAAVISHPDYLHRLSMAYMHSKSIDAGYFFIAVEYSLSQTLTDTCHDIVYFYLDVQLNNSSIYNVGPGYISTFNPAWAGNLGHPDVLAENDTAINDSFDVSVLILFNTASGLNSINSMRAYFAPSTNSDWLADTIISAGAIKPTTANGVFDRVSHNFVFTTGDINAQTLDYYTCNENGITTHAPGNWTPAYVNYSDSINTFTNPDPHCEVNPKDNSVGCDWIAGTNAYTFFDAADRTTGVAATTVLPPVKLYPNPADQYISITLPNAFSATTRIDVFNVLGEMMYTLPQTAKTQVQINTSQWAAGSYYVRLYDGANEQVKKFTLARY